MMILAMWLWLAQASLSIRVEPRMVIQGHQITIACRLTPSAENRWLSLELTPVRRSTVELHGADAPILHELIVRRVPCEAVEAACILGTTREVHRVAASVTVTQCE